MAGVVWDRHEATTVHEAVTAHNEAVMVHREVDSGRHGAIMAHPEAIWARIEAVHRACVVRLRQAGVGLQMVGRVRAWESQQP